MSLPSKGTQAKEHMRKTKGASAHPATDGRSPGTERGSILDRHQRVDSRAALPRQRHELLYKALQGHTRARDSGGRSVAKMNDRSVAGSPADAVTRTVIAGAGRYLASQSSPVVADQNPSSLARAAKSVASSDLERGSPVRPGSRISFMTYETPTRWSGQAACMDPPAPA